MGIYLQEFFFFMIFRCSVGVIRCRTLSSCMNVLDNSTQQCDFLRMCSKGMFGLILCGIQSVGPLKALYTLHPDIHVHSDTNLSALESVQLVANTTRRLFHSCVCMLQSPSIVTYSFIQLRELGVVEIANAASL